MTTDPLVNIVMPTYNHDKYIGQAIESVLMQRCDFNYRIVIGEDGSTDRTREISEKYQKDYPDKILLLKNEARLGLIRNYKKILDACAAKYIAILESDDYWIDPLKLQKQVDIMEADEGMGVVHSSSFVLYEDGTMKRTSAGFDSRENVDFVKCIRDGFAIVPLTALFRHSLYLKHIDMDWAVENSLWTFDAFLWPGLLKYAKAIRLGECTGVRRILGSSISNAPDFKKNESRLYSALLIKKYYLKKYHLPTSLSKVAAPEYSLIVRKALEVKLFDAAKIYGKKIDAYNFWTLKAWLFSKSPFFYPLFKLDLFTLRALSSLKQILLRWSSGAGFNKRNFLS